MLRALLRPFVAVLALLLLFEEWLWDLLKTQLRRLGQLPLVRQFEDALRRLPPWASVLVMMLPALVLLPFKMLGLWAVAHRHPLLGVGIVAAAKIIGTALAAHLFDLVRDNALRVRWFAALYRFVMGLLAKAHAWLERQPLYQSVRAWARTMRVRARGWLNAVFKT